MHLFVNTSFLICFLVGSSLHNLHYLPIKHVVPRFSCNLNNKKSTFVQSKKLYKGRMITSWGLLDTLRARFLRSCAFGLFAASKISLAIWGYKHQCRSRWPSLPSQSKCKKQGLMAWGMQLCLSIWSQLTRQFLIMCPENHTLTPSKLCRSYENMCISPNH